MRRTQHREIRTAQSSHLPRVAILDLRSGVLEQRLQAPPDREIGWDVSASLQWRPFMSQNVVLNASAAALLPGKGFERLYDEDRRGAQYSILVNLLLSY